MTAIVSSEILPEPIIWVVVAPTIIDHMRKCPAGADHQKIHSATRPPAFAHSSKNSF